ncbi:integrin alpha-1 isoform X1 [Ciona intestinalis]
MRESLKFILICTVFFRQSEAYFLEVRENATNAINFNNTIDVETTNGALPGYSLIASMEQNVISLLAGAPKFSGLYNIGSTGDGAVIKCSATIQPFSSATNAGNTKWMTDHSCSVVLNTNAVPTGDNQNKSADAIGLTMIPLGGNKTAVCSPGRRKICGRSLRLSPGACYTGTLGAAMTMKTGWGEIPCFKNYLDLVYVVDSSNSISDANFTIMKQIIVNASEAFKASIGDTTQVAVLQYGNLDSAFFDHTDSKYYKSPTKLGDCNDIDCFNQAIEANMIHLKAANTFTSYAIKRAVEFDFAQSKNKDKAKKILVLITDGQANFRSQLIKSYDLTQLHNITVYAIGVALKSDAELRISANGGGSKERVLDAHNYSELSKALRNLTETIAQTSGEGQAIGGITLENAVLGVSANYNPKGGELFFSGVGSYDGSGAIIKYDSISSITGDVTSHKQVPGLFPKFPKDSYLGYSIASGYFEGNGTLYVATGAPRHALLGLVLVYEPQTGNSASNPRIIKPNNCSSCSTNYKQLGSYFGATLLSADINGDGKDDLLVGAPLYIGDNYDEGRVFVYLSQASNSIQAWASPGFVPKVFSGMKDVGGRFGSAISSAGDLNDDGFNDVIISAPLADNGAGVVYVYHGSNNLNTVYSQRIQSSSLQFSHLSNFGLSTSSGADLDGNKYPDVVVGAPNSNLAIIFRSRPVARFSAQITLNPPRRDIFECLQLPSGKCFNVTSCLTVYGKSVEDFLDVNVMILLDKSKKRLNLGGFTNTTREVKLSRNVTSCWSYDVYVTKNMIDFVSPLSAEVQYSLTSAHSNTPMSSMVDPAATNKVSTTAIFNTGCTSDLFCSYDLMLNSSITLPKTTNQELNSKLGNSVIIIDKDTATKPIILHVTISNVGENAYGVKFDVTYSSSLIWNGIKEANILNHRNSSCFDEVNIQDQTLGQLKIKSLTYKYNEELGSIMPAGDSCSFEIHLLPTNLKTSGVIQDVYTGLHVYTMYAPNGNDSNPSNNVANYTRTIRYVSDVSVTRRESTQFVTREFTFPTTNETVHSVYEIGRNVSTIAVAYEISSEGYSVVPSSSFFLRYPTNISEHNLLYLYKVSCIGSQGPVMCNCSTQNVNRYQLSTSPNITDKSGPSIMLLPNPTQLPLSVYNCSTSIIDPPSYCEELHCSVNNLVQGSKVNFVASFRFWSHSVKLVDYPTVTFVTGFSYTTNQSALIINKNGSMITEYSAETEIAVKKYVPPVVIEELNLLLIVIISAAVTLLLVIVGLGVLYKKGFFESEYNKLMKEEKHWQEVNATQDRTDVEVYDEDL